MKTVAIKLGGLLMNSAITPRSLSSQSHLEGPLHSRDPVRSKDTATFRRPFLLNFDISVNENYAWDLGDRLEIVTLIMLHFLFAIYVIGFIKSSK